jgi:hypothetical protein
MIAPDIGNKQKLLHKCQGNLYLLKYYFMAWEKQPQCVLSDIEESAVLGNIHARFLSDKSYAEALARLAALGQFETPADRVFFANPDALEQDLVVERRESRRGDPQLRLYHATPARYLALAHIHHIRGRRHFNAWTLDMLSDYLLSRPSNFFVAMGKSHC